MRTPRPRPFRPAGDTSPAGLPSQGVQIRPARCARACAREASCQPQPRHALSLPARAQARAQAPPPPAVPFPQPPPPAPAEVGEGGVIPFNPELPEPSLIC